MVACDGILNSETTEGAEKSSYLYHGGKQKRVAVMWGGTGELSCGEEEELLLQGAKNYYLMLLIFKECLPFYEKSLMSPGYLLFPSRKGKYDVKIFSCC